MHFFNFFVLKSVCFISLFKFSFVTVIRGAKRPDMYNGAALPEACRAAASWSRFNGLFSIYVKKQKNFIFSILVKVGKILVRRSNLPFSPSHPNHLIYQHFPSPSFHFPFIFHIHHHFNHHSLLLLSFSFTSSSVFIRKSVLGKSKYDFRQKKYVFRQKKYIWRFRQKNIFLGKRTIRFRQKDGILSLLNIS